ncbi:MAG TPA: hypothetical protein VGI78_18080 [Acetobacteraceae bacterium]
MPKSIANYRRRQGERGISRYEVRGLDSDKPLVRQTAARLAANDPGARRLGAELMREVAGARPAPGGIFAALRRSPMVGVELELERRACRWAATQRSRHVITTTAVVHDCVVVTANERHFRDVVSHINPAAPPAGWPV